MSKWRLQFDINWDKYKEFNDHPDSEKVNWRIDLLQWMENVKELELPTKYAPLKSAIKAAFSILPDDFDIWFEKWLETMQTEQLLFQV